VILLVVLFIGLLSLRGLATLWTDYLWFDSVGFGSVWVTLMVNRVMLVVIASLLAFGLLYLNLVLADRLAPRRLLPTGSPDEELVERFQEWVAPRLGRFRLAVAGFFGLLIGLGAGAWWEHWLMFRHRQSFALADPLFFRDIGFYVFQVPFLRDLFGWAFQLVLITTLVVAALHYLNGGIQIQARGQAVAGGVKVHLSVLLALVALLKAFGYWLDRFDLLYSERGAVFGATYTDVNAQLPALNLLIGISVVAAVLLLVNIRNRGWTLPAVAVGLWLVTSIGLGGLWPAVVQRFAVEPDEINRELPFVQRNIEFTSIAYGLDTIETRPYAASLDLTAVELTENVPTTSNVRLWDPNVLITTYRQLQELRPFYQFTDIDVDRYVIDGRLTQVMLAARELDDRNLPGAGWVNQHLVYTHGYGVVVSPANTVTVEGQPAFMVRDITPGPDVPEVLQIDEPRIYFGDARLQHSYVIAGTEEREVDFPLETGTGADTVAFTSYTGRGGVGAGGVFRRAAFALRFADINILISGQIRSDSRVLMVRNVRDRVAKAAPMLAADTDPYLVVHEGRLVWIQDMYTVTDRFPYSTPASDPGATAGGVPAAGRLNVRSGLPNDFNYIRNSVKATIDAHDGTLTFYVMDPTDPMIRAWRSVFPALFSDIEEMPQNLLDHIRYPEDLFRVQSGVFTRYHMTDPRVFFNNGDPWEISRDPSTTPVESLRFQFDAANRPMMPYYLLMRLPDEDDISYLLLQSFTAATRPNMVSFIVAKSGFDVYGEMSSFELPRDVFVDGPGQVGARINQNPEISREFTLLGQEGSEVIQGNMLIVPIEESVLYVQPIYLSARRTQAADGVTALPEFKFAIVVFGDRIAMRETLAESLFAVFGDAPVVPDPDDPDPRPDPDLPDDVSAAVASLLDRAQQAFERADAALRAGDLGTFQAQVTIARNLIAEAHSLIAAATE
jgi:uncharacterized protein